MSGIAQNPVTNIPNGFKKRKVKKHLHLNQNVQKIGNIKDIFKDYLKKRYQIIIGFKMMLLTS